MSDKKLKPSKIDEFTIGEVEFASISIFKLDTPNGTKFNPVIDFGISQDEEHEPFVTSVSTKFFADTIASAIYTAFRLCDTFTDSVIDTVLVFDAEGEIEDEVSLNETMNEIKRKERENFLQNLLQNLTIPDDAVYH